MIEYKLSQLLQIADKGFKTLFAGFDFWCVSEVIKVQQVGKNTYLELVEYDSEGKMIAKAKGCIFNEAICKNFLQETGIKSIQELAGGKILFNGYFSFHTEYGFSLVMKELSAEYTIGHMQKKQDDIILELQKLGILHANRQQQRGYPPYTIAIITGATSAGLMDFQSVMKQSPYHIHYEYYYCAVNGNNAVAEVAEQLQIITKDIKAGAPINAVALVRGGGGSSDIVRQNDLAIAKGVCQMPVPVVVAIGHTPDKFVLHDLARYAAKTPTDAAYRIVELLQERDEDIQNIYSEIEDGAADRLHILRQQIDLRNTNIGQKLTRFLHDTRLHIDARYATILATTPEKMLQNGYALLLQNGEYLDSIGVNKLKVGETLQIKVYNKEISVRIDEIKGTG